MAISDDIQYWKSSKKWVVGPKKVRPPYTRGPFKYYVIKEVGGVRKMAILADLQYCLY